MTSDILPALPRVVRKREADITPRILAWFRDNATPCCALEIKATRGTSIAAGALLPHQRLALLQACGSGIVHKLSDEARRKQPFDAFKLAGVPGYVVAAFLGKNPVALVIPVEEWHGARRDTPCAWRIEL